MDPMIKKRKVIQLAGGQEVDKYNELAEVDIALSVPVLPIEMYMKILGEAFDSPVIFNFCYFNHQWNDAIHKHFNNIGVIDVPKYVTYDKSRDIAEQMKFLIKTKRHKATGIDCCKYQRSTMDVVAILPLRRAVKHFIGIAHLQVFRFHEDSVSQLNRVLFRRHVASLLNLVSNAVNLKQLSIELPHVITRYFGTGWFPSLNLSNLTSLEILRGKSVVYNNCTSTKLIELDCCCVDFLDIEKVEDFQVLLRAVAPTLERLKLKELHDCMPFEDNAIEIVRFEMPKLKQMELYGLFYWGFSTIDCWTIDLTNAVDLEQVAISRHDIHNSVNIVGFDAGSHRNVNKIVFDCGFAKYDFCVLGSFLNYFDVESFGRLEHLELTGVPAALFSDLLNKFPNIKFYCSLCHLSILVSCDEDRPVYIPLDKLVNIITSASNLTHVRLRHIDIGHYDLIQIINSMLTNDVRLRFEFDNIIDRSFIDFLRILAGQASFVEAYVEKRKYPFHIGIVDLQHDYDNEDDVSTEISRLKCTLKNIFGICFE